MLARMGMPVSLCLENTFSSRSIGGSCTDNLCKGWNAGPAAPEANGFNAGAAPFGGSAPHYGGSDIGDLDGGAEDGNIGDDCCR